MADPPIRRAADAAARATLRLGPEAVLVIILSAGIALFFALTTVAAEIYEAVADEDGVAGLDRPLLDAAIALRTPEGESALTAFTNLAGTIGMPVIAVTALLVLSLRRRSLTPALLIAATGIGSLLMTVAGKRLIGRERPPLVDAVPPFETSASFPSGHTLNAVAIIGVVAYLLVLEQKRGWVRTVTISVAAAFMIATGVTRVYLGHHWFTDVAFAWALGLAWLAVVITAHQTVRLLRARPHPRE